MITASSSQPGVRRAKPNLVLAVLASSALSVSIMQTMLIPLIPELPHTLGVSADDASWLVTATLVTGAVAMPTITRLADMFGKRRMLMVCMLLLLAGSLLGVFASGLPALITARALQGCALAAIPVAMSVARDELPPERLAFSVALISASLGVGGAVGIPLTGVVFNAWGWHAAFWLAGGMALIGVVAVRLVMPESPEKSGGEFDLVGAVLLSVALVALLLGVTQGNHWGWFSASTLGAFGATVLIFAAWVPWELRLREPLVDLRISARRPVLLTNIAALLSGIAMFINMLATMQQLQIPTATGYGFGLTVLQAGVVFIPIGMIVVVVVPLAAAITRKFGARTTLIVGGLVMGVGFLDRLEMMASAWQVVLGACIVSTGMTLSFAALPVIIMRHVPLTETAAANGINTLARMSGLALGSAAVAALLAGVTTIVNGIALPSETALVITFLVAAVASFGATAVAIAIPRHAATDSGFPDIICEGTVA